MSYIPPPQVRPIAIGVVRRDRSILVFEGHDSLKHQIFYRPLGGTIEFGELGAEAVAREFQEEIGADLVNLRLLGTLENRFELEGHPGHEIVLVYEAELAEPALYETEETTGYEDSGKSFKVLWKQLSDFGPGADPLYPDGLAELLAGE